MLKSFRSGPGRASSPAPSEPASLGGLRTQDSPVSAASFIIANDFVLDMSLLRFSRCSVSRKSQHFSEPACSSGQQQHASDRGAGGRALLPRSGGA